MSHRRRNPLTGAWVLVSPHRISRPWSGALDEDARDPRPAHDPACQLCPGNTRANGAVNPAYDGVFAFDNDFMALHECVDDTPPSTSGLFVAEGVRGLCRVLCFSPRHDASLATMNAAEIGAVVDAWCRELAGLAATEHMRSAQIFENRGAHMGASNPHPHGQIWAQDHLTGDAALEDAQQRAFARDHHRCLLCRAVEDEIAGGARVVIETPSFAAVVPFWAAWPFELLLVPKAHHDDLRSLAAGAAHAELVDVLRRIFITYDRLFAAPMPLTWGFHGAPFHVDAQGRDAWHVHAHFFPPLLRSAAIRKWMVGYELLVEPQRDLTPEAAAERLRAVVPP